MAPNASITYKGAVVNHKTYRKDKLEGMSWKAIQKKYGQTINEMCLQNYESDEPVASAPPIPAKDRDLVYYAVITLANFNLFALVFDPMSLGLFLFSLIASLLGVTAVTAFRPNVIFLIIRMNVPATKRLCRAVQALR